MSEFPAIRSNVDPLRDEAVAFPEWLKDAGVSVELREFGHLTHGFVALAALAPRRAEAAVIAQ